MTEEAKTTGGPPVSELVEKWLVAHPRVKARKPNLPKLEGVLPNPGVAL